VVIFSTKHVLDQYHLAEYVSVFKNIGNDMLFSFNLMTISFIILLMPGVILTIILFGVFNFPSILGYQYKNEDLLIIYD
jgi:hypothetical protein